MDDFGPEALFRQAVTRHLMVRPGDRVLAGLSGGGDSVLMLMLLAELRGSIPFTLEAGHLNHGLRGSESDADEAFSRELAGRLALRFHAGRADLARRPGDPSSVEERAREARRGFLRETAARQGCGRIALGHTLDDQAETILMWLLRGTGRGGMAGMEPVTAEGIVRPMILARRSAIRAHLRSSGQPFRDDATNDDLSRTRNRIRLRLLALLDEEFPGSVGRIAAAAATIAAEEELLDALADDLFIAPDGGLDLPAMGGAVGRAALAPRAVRRAAARQGMDFRLLDRSHVEAILALATGSRGAGIDLPGGFRAVIESGKVYFRPAGPRQS